MNCPTCHVEIDEPVHFCPHCGWPAARLMAELPGNTLGVSASAESALPLLLSNTGAGPVEYSVRIADEQPWAFLLSSEGRKTTFVRERRLRPGSVDNSLRVGANGPDVPAAADHIAVEVRSCDRGGATGDHLRPWSVSEHRWRTWQVHVPLKRLGEAEIHIGQTLVIFTTHQREQRVTVRNLGGTATRVRLEGLPGGVRGSWEAPPEPGPEDILEISFDDEAPVYVENAQEPQMIPGEGALVLTLRADDDFHGVARARIIDGDEPHELTLYGEPTQQSAGLVQHWTVGIDFGTAKSAVYYTDNWVKVEEREPQPILWPAGPSSTNRTETTTRSAVMYERGAETPLCGHHVVTSAGAESADELVVESIKTRLRGEAAERPVTLPGGGETDAVHLVVEFMRYLIEEVRGSRPFRGNVDMDARLVLTLPVMDTRDAFDMQRQSTLRAAEMAGLPVSELLTPGEPECAALDLMHSLRRGDYTFNGKPYQLQDNETMLVFDCGAGTTDIALLRVVLSDGKFEAEQLATAGYRFGGDTVDDLLLSWVLEQQGDAVQLGWNRGRAMVKPAGMDRPLPLYAAREECRRLKESLFMPEAASGTREFHTDLGTLELGPAHVERLVVPFLETMFTAGIMPDPRLFFPDLDARLDDKMREALWREMVPTAKQKVRTLDRAMREAGLRRGDVTFLFITGGTGQIPIIAPKLYDFMGRSARIVVATPEDCTVNVARGASLYYDYRLSGILRCGVDVVGRDPDTGREFFRRQVCPYGALPGLSLERAVRMEPRQALEIGLWADCAREGPDGYIAGHVVRNASADPRQLVIQAEYGSDRALSWGAAFVDGQVAIPRELVLRT